MGRFIYFMTILSMVYLPLCSAQDCCSEESRGECGCATQRGHVQTFFSGVHEENVIDPREDYQWPGMNEDAFYDYFTK